MNISIITLFPEMFTGPFDYSIVKRAQEKGLVAIQTINIRDYADDAYKSVDDHPYGGGVGMIMKVDVIDRALQQVKSHQSSTVTPAHAGVQSKKRDPRLRGDDIHTVLLDPRGTPFTQAKARELTKFNHLILICGHYEGVDARVKKLVDESISIGDYVLTGGELPAMMVTDTVVRLIPGVLKLEATSYESFSLPSPSLTTHHSSLTLEYPQYTRPEKYKGMSVPSVLLSGNHKKIEQWKKDHTTAQKDRVSRP